MAWHRPAARRRDPRRRSAATGRAGASADCAQEPIHIPGSVQPHGVLLAVEPVSGQVVQVSANSGQVLGIEPAGILGRSLDLVLEPASALALLQSLIDPSDDSVDPVRRGWVAGTST